MRPTLTICIPTVLGREKKFDALIAELNRQIAEDTLQGIVEVVFMKDNKQISIGAKRQKLYEMAKGWYSIQIDDDDFISGDFCKRIAHACESGVDCIGYLESVVINGKNEGNSIFTKNYGDWVEKIIPCAENHFCARARTPFFKTPIKTELCLKVGVVDMRFGEDHDFARRILSHLRTEIFIPEVMYHYRNEKEGTHNQRYGIK